MRLRHTVVVRVSRDSDFKKAMWSPEVASAEVVLDGFQKQASGNFEVPAASTELLSMGDISDVKGVYLEVDGPAQVHINGSLDQIELVPGEAGKPAKLFLEAELSQVRVDNPDAAVALTGVFVFWGDPTV